MAIELTDDGTMDTVLRCDECGEEFRFNYSDGPADGPRCEHGLDDGCSDCYDDFVDDSIAEIEAEHRCRLLDRRVR